METSCMLGPAVSQDGGCLRRMLVGRYEAIRVTYLDTSSLMSHGCDAGVLAEPQSLGPGCAPGSGAS